MTPHGIIEDMTTIETMFGDKLADKFDLRIWASIKLCAKEAIHFDFGTAKPLPEHQQFAGQMYDRQMFKVPYPQVLFTAEALPRTGLLALQSSDGGSQFNVIVMAPAVIGDLRLTAPLLGLTIDGDTWEGSTVNWKSLTATNHASRKTGRPWETSDYEAAADKAIGFVAGATCMLMSKDVEMTLAPSADKLNAKRGAAGRPLVRQHMIVRIKPDRIARYRQAEDDERAGRTSPRMHMRRGHFRRIRDDFVVPVAPSIINMAPGARPTAKTYKVG